MRGIFERVKSIRRGENASYIPALSEVDSSLFGVSICSVDGQRFHVGDVDVDFCIQSCSKPLTYLTAAQLTGVDFVHRFVGKEPSGVAFNSLTLKKCKQKDGSILYMPHNSMINAGAIMCCSIIRETKGDEQKAFEAVAERVARVCAEEKVTFSDDVYSSELENCDRNRCLAYMMREYHSFPSDKVNVDKVLELYFKTCAIELNTKQCAVIAATLANGGVCPLNNDAIFDSINVRNCLSQMLSCGMYDYSGEWAFSIGLPAKSGVSGCIMIVIPNKMGIAIYSPRLDEMGNSVRGIEFAKQFVKAFNVHHLDSLRAKGAKIEPNLPYDKTETSKLKLHQLHISNLLVSAARGDLNEIKRLVSIGLNPFEPGVDERTALHLAACENREGVIIFLLKIAKTKKLPVEEVLVKDSFGNTPLEDAQREKALRAEKLIRDYLEEEAIKN